MKAKGILAMGIVTASLAILEGTGICAEIGSLTRGFLGRIMPA